MKKYIIVILIFLLYSCGANKYSSLSKYNYFESEGDYYRFKNDSAKVTMLIFGNFKMAQNKKQFDSIRSGLNTPIHKFKGEKLFYLQNSTSKTYDCALMIHDKDVPPIKESEKIITKSIKCGNLVLSFKISKEGHKETRQFYLDNFKCVN
ncbi:hypothetical protein [Chryseobacterium lathyri]|uniref:hypothetical protein n=1 Tax=Chryseobacterium lathyri TaxID=395933 RepID=UPI002782C87E|nr:hypothetical protein [Chryseobacterium lathyri]MDQ0064672.1 hypothetical protein [Chryseobacterium lathyri]